MRKARSQNLVNNWLPLALLRFVALSCLFCGYCIKAELILKK